MDAKRRNITNNKIIKFFLFMVQNTIFDRIVTNQESEKIITLPIIFKTFFTVHK